MLSQIREQDEGVAYLTRVVEGKLTTPLMLVGCEGVGKRFSILQVAKEVFGPDSALQIDRGLHPDLLVISPQDGKDIGVDEIRDMIDRVYDFPVVAPKRYVVIDGADRMTTAAANALLKTLEEPPDTTQFFVLAESERSVLPTIRSRCGKVGYKRLSEKFVTESLTPFSTDRTKVLVYARLSEGSVGRALAYFGSNRIDLRDRVFDVLKKGLGGDVSSLFSAVDNISVRSNENAGSIADLKLGLRFLDQLLYDLAMTPYDASQITNLDLEEELRVVGRQIGQARLRTLSKGLNSIQRTQAKINLSFHVKSLLASTFVV